MANGNACWIKWGAGLAVTIAIAASPGLIGYGVTQNKVEASDKKIEKNSDEIKENREAIRRLETGQVEIKTKVDNEARQQESYRTRTEKLLDRILNKLDDPTRGRN